MLAGRRSFLGGLAAFITAWWSGSKASAASALVVRRVVANEPAPIMVIWHEAPDLPAHVLDDLRRSGPMAWLNNQMVITAALEPALGGPAR